MRWIRRKGRDTGQSREQAVAAMTDFRRQPAHTSGDPPSTARKRQAAGVNIACTSLTDRLLPRDPTARLERAKGPETGRSRKYRPSEGNVSFCAAFATFAEIWGMSLYGRKYVFLVSVSSQGSGLRNGKCLLQTRHLVESNINNHLTTEVDPKLSFRK